MSEYKLLVIDNETLVATGVAMVIAYFAHEGRSVWGNRAAVARISAYWLSILVFVVMGFAALEMWLVPHMHNPEVAQQCVEAFRMVWGALFATAALMCGITHHHWRGDAEPHESWQTICYRGVRVTALVLALAVGCVLVTSMPLSSILTVVLLVAVAIPGAKLYAISCRLAWGERVDREIEPHMVWAPTVLGVLGAWWLCALVVVPLASCDGAPQWTPAPFVWVVLAGGEMLLAAVAVHILVGAVPGLGLVAMPGQLLFGLGVPAQLAVGVGWAQGDHSLLAAGTIVVLVSVLLSLVFLFYGRDVAAREDSEVRSDAARVYRKIPNKGLISERDLRKHLPDLSERRVEAALKHLRTHGKIDRMLRGVSRS